MRLNEYPVDPGTWRSDVIPVGGGRAPDTDIEALMVGAEHSVESLAAVREAIADALDTLTDKERWMFDRLFIEGWSLRTLGEALGHGEAPTFGKTHMARMRDEILDKLRLALVDDPAIKGMLA